MKDLNSQVFDPSLLVLEINTAYMWLDSWYILASATKPHPSRYDVSGVCKVYGCDDGATVSREKSFQALPPIFLQSCETKSGTESLGSRLVYRVSDEDNTYASA